MLNSFENPFVSLRLLPVLHGDAIHLAFSGSDNVKHHIFIDGGFESTYQATLRKEVEVIRNSDEKIDLFIVTHTDHDHIGGVIRFVKDNQNDGLVKQFWFNHSLQKTIQMADGDEISIGDGIELREYLLAENLIPDPVITNDFTDFNLYGGRFRVLSPSRAILENYQTLWDKQEENNIINSDDISSEQNDLFVNIEKLFLRPFQEDRKVENMVSIAFIFEYMDKSILFLADSTPSTVVKSLTCMGYSPINRLKVDLVKLSHHGSKFNTSNELISIIDCQKFVISANGKNRFNFPHKEALSRVIKNPLRDLSKKITFYFNYDNEILRRIISDDEKLTYNISCEYPKGEEGNVLAINL